ncbi:MAG: hypothetical protein H6667_14255 [Ardenticatenaceae bacterium]|nr:hypothetical protein [Ardenticatenaceae bacterium]
MRGFWERQVETVSPSSTRPTSTDGLQRKNGSLNSESVREGDVFAAISWAAALIRLAGQIPHLRSCGSTPKTLPRHLEVEALGPDPITVSLAGGFAPG